MTRAGWIPLVAWPTVGAIAGVTFGLMVVAPPTVREVVAPFLGVALLVGGTGLAVRYGRRALRTYRATPRRARVASSDAAPAPAPAARDAPALAVRVAFPEIPDTVPDVWGAGDALTARAVARDGARAAAGATVALRLLDKAGGRTLAEARVGADGALEAPLVVAAPAEVTVEATATHEGHTVRARRDLRIVRYAEEVQHLFDEFREWANASVPGCRDALTAREVADTLAPHVDAEGARALADVTRVYEIVTYGERPADRGLYLALVTAFRDADEAGVFQRFDKSAPPAAGSG